uniref:Uncharacterized protein n=1 Tax=Salix viminalis TaxID=40686 RepID=A0A6N2LPN2_SALVM
MSWGVRIAVNLGLERVYPCGKNTLIHQKSTAVLKAQYHFRATGNEENSSLARPRKGLSFMEVNSIFNFNCFLVDV